MIDSYDNKQIVHIVTNNYKKSFKLTLRLKSKYIKLGDRHQTSQFLSFLKVFNVQTRFI